MKFDIFRSIIKLTFVTLIFSYVVHDDGKFIARPNRQHFSHQFNSFKVIKTVRGAYEYVRRSAIVIVFARGFGSIEFSRESHFHFSFASNLR